MSEVILNPNDAHQTAEGRFFINEEVRAAAYEFSEDFIRKHADFLIEGYGVVLQSGLNQSGELVRLDDSINQQATFTLIFDASQSEAGIYAWQHTSASPNYGRITEQIVISRHTLETNCFTYNNQGFLVKSEPGTAVSGIMQVVEAATQNLLFFQYTNELRQRKLRAEADYYDFEEAAITKFSPEQFKKMLDQKWKHMTTIGFGALQLAGGQVQQYRQLRLFDPQPVLPSILQ
jgi:hypothetical protein